jgi:hypothetical protein
MKALATVVAVLVLASVLIWMAISWAILIEERHGQDIRRRNYKKGM